MTWDRESIRALAAKPYEELTNEERKLVNLNKGMWKKGETGPNSGRKKGCKNWSTIFQRIMGDADFLYTVVTTLPKDWANVIKDTPGEVIAAALVANILKGVAKSLNSDAPLNKDVRDAIALLNKLGYGDKIVHEDPDGFFSAPVIKYEVVSSKPEALDSKENEDTQN